MVAQAHLKLLKLAASGASAAQISEQTGIPEAAVRVILRSPLAQAELARAS